MIYWLFRLAGLLIPRIPLRLAYWIAERGADVGYRLGGQGRANVRHNMRHVLGAAASPQRLDQVARQVFRNQAKNMVDMFRLPALTPAQVEGLVTLHGWEYVAQAQARGKGIVFTSAHFGELDVAVQIAACRGLKPVVLHEQLEPQRLYDYVVGIRSRMGIVFVPIGEPNTLRRAFRTLKENGLLGVVADRDVTNNGRLVSFFGALARLPDGHVTLARRTGAAILVAFSLRRPDDSYEVYVEPPIILEPSDDREQDVQHGVERVAASMERYIGAHPEQWVYFQPVWVES